MNIMNAFPTPIGFFDIQDSSSLNKGLSDFIYSIKHEDSPNRSMIGGYHSNEDLLSRDNKFIKSFHKIISYQIKEYYRKSRDLFY